MKKLILSSLLFWSIKSLAGAVPLPCDRLLNGSDYFLDGYVESISEDKECITSNCSSYEIHYTARFIVNKSIKGDIAPGSVVYIKYEEPFHSPEDDFGPGFQGHDPKPKASENWKVFVDGYGDNTFTVAPPNGWWPSENVECWLDSSAKPILERHHEETWTLIDDITYVRGYAITVYSDGTVYLTEKSSDYDLEKKELIATLSEMALWDITRAIHNMHPGALTFSEDPDCANTRLVSYVAKKYDFQFESILFAQANECKNGFIEHYDQEDLLRVQKILDGFSLFFED